MKVTPERGLFEDKFLVHLGKQFVIGTSQYRKGISIPIMMCQKSEYHGAVLAWNARDQWIVIRSDRPLMEKVETLLHELAHAECHVLVGYQNLHSPEWVKICKSFGLEVKMGRDLPIETAEDQYLNGRHYTQRLYSWKSTEIKIEIEKFRSGGWAKNRKIWMKELGGRVG